MRKIPTLFERDPDNRAHVLPKVTEGCEWVFAGEGKATRKYDGTCILIRRDGMAVKGYARREVKSGKEPPPNFVGVAFDEVTGKRMGWEPIGQSSFAPFFTEAIAGTNPIPGTYELCGPKINGNPEGFTRHTLVSHANAERYRFLDRPYGWNDLLTHLTSLDWEGIVWHHPDGRMVKLKRRDFPTSCPL